MMQVESRDEFSKHVVYLTHFCLMYDLSREIVINLDPNSRTACIQIHKDNHLP